MQFTRIYIVLCLSKDCKVISWVLRIINIFFHWFLMGNSASNLCLCRTGNSVFNPQPHILNVLNVSPQNNFKFAKTSPIMHKLRHHDCVHRSIKQISCFANMNFLYKWFCGVLSFKLNHCRSYLKIA